MSAQRCLLASGEIGWKWGNAGIGRTTKLEALRDGVAKLTVNPLTKWNENQERDDNGRWGEGGGAEKPVTVQQKEAPKFVHDFIREHSTGNKVKAELKTRSTEHLQTAIRLMEGHIDAATNMLRDMAQEELKSRGAKSETSHISKGELSMSGFRIFAQLQKVDAEKRLVYGRAVQEVVDKSDEIFDYAGSKPYFKAWSAEVSKDSGGKSLGNLRAMHGKVAAGKLTAIDFNDAAKAIDVCAKVVDDAEWNKVMEGVYTGFSIGGKYVGEKTTEKFDGRDVQRYVADPSELSLVDRPCVGTSKFFDVVKVVGGKEVQIIKMEFAEKGVDGRARVNESVGTDGRQDASVSTGVVAVGATSSAAENITDPLKRPTINNNITEVNAAEDPARKDKKTDVAGEHEEQQDDDVDAATDNPDQVGADKALMIAFLEKREGADKAAIAKLSDVELKKAYDAAKVEQPEYAVEGTAEEVAALAKLMGEARLTTGTVLKIVQDAVTFSKADDIRVFMMPMSIETLGKYAEEHKDSIDKIQHIDKSEFSVDARSQAVAAGLALPDGSYAIYAAPDVTLAVKAHSRAKDKDAAQKHVVARARALGVYDSLPKEWKTEKMFDSSTVRKALKDGVTKGVYDMAQLASVVQALHSLCSNPWYEKVAEDGDDLLVPDALKKNVSDLVTTLSSMVDEETAELLSAIDPTEKVDAVSMFSRLAKIGARNNKNDIGRIQKVHDIACDLGAGCGATDKLADEKGALGLDKATGNAFEKAVHSAVEKLVKPVSDALAKAEARVKHLEDQPAPTVAVLRAVGKSNDLSSGDGRLGTVVEVAPVMKDGKVDEATTAIKKLHASGGRTILNIGNPD